MTCKTLFLSSAVVSADMLSLNVLDDERISMDEWCRPLRVRQLMLKVATAEWVARMESRHNSSFLGNQMLSVICCVCEHKRTLPCFHHNVGTLHRFILISRNLTLMLTLTVTRVSYNLMMIQHYFPHKAFGPHNGRGLFWDPTPPPLSLSLTSERLCPGLAYPPSASLRCSDSWVTDITSPPTVTNGRVVGRVHWMRGEEGGCLSQAHGIHDILYWALCWKGENQLHHPYKWPGLMKMSFVLFFYLLFLIHLPFLSSPWTNRCERLMSRGAEPLRWVWGHAEWPTVL